MFLLKQIYLIFLNHKPIEKEIKYKIINIYNRKYQKLKKNKKYHQTPK